MICDDHHNNDDHDDDNRDAAAENDNDDDDDSHNKGKTITICHSTGQAYANKTHNFIQWPNYI